MQEHEYVTQKTNLSHWQPVIEYVLRENKLPYSGGLIEAGFNSTYPVFLMDNWVVKFFGHRNNWQQVFTTECEAHQLLATNTAILVPSLLASGQISDTWAYTLSARIGGQSWLASTLTKEQKQTITSEIGKQLKLIHSLPTNRNFPGDENWGRLNLKEAAKKSSLPNHLIEQIDDFLPKLDSFDRVFVNGDIVDMHVFIENGHLSSIIDWGDAMVVDRHYEIGKLSLSLFPGDKELLKTLLEAANWPMTKNFARKTLGLALYRQAVGLTQHHSFDIFHKVPDVLPTNEIGSLDELADKLFQL
jgi:aminoglycoside phosphotransferase